MQMHQYQGQDQEASESLSQSLSPFKVRYRSQKNDAQRSFCSRTVPYRPRLAICALVVTVIFLFRHVVERLSVSTEPRGLGAGFDRSFRHMSHACSEPRARSSRGHRRSRRTIRIAVQRSLVVGEYFTVLATILIPTPRMMELAGPRRSSVLSLGEAFGGVCFAFWLGGSPLARLCGCSSVRGSAAPRPFPSKSGGEQWCTVVLGWSSVATGPRSAD
jgi:hypothetical protein